MFAVEETEVSLDLRNGKLFDCALKFAKDIFGAYELGPYLLGLRYERTFLL
jgi:hypothetical protein